MVDAQLVAASLRACAPPRTSQPPPGCPAIDPVAFATSMHALVATRPGSGASAAVREVGAREPGSSWGVLAGPRPPSPFMAGPIHPPRSPLGTSACTNAFPGVESRGCAPPCMPNCGPRIASARATPTTAAPSEASQLPEYLQSTLSTLRGFMDELQISSDGPVRTHCLPCN